MRAWETFTLAGIILLTLTVYAMSQVVFNGYLEHYGKPFGKGDVDNYMEFLMYPQAFHYDPVHYFFINSVLTASDVLGAAPKVFLTYFIPAVCFLVYPLLMYMFLHSLQEGVENIYGVYFFIFGTHITFFTGLVAVWAQSVSYIFYLLSLVMLARFYSRGRGLTRFYCFAFVACLFHPYMVGIYLLMLLGYSVAVRDRRLLLCFLVGLMVFVVWTGYGWLRFTIWSGAYGEPDMYLLFYVYVSPFLYCLALLGLAQTYPIRFTRMLWAVMGVLLVAGLFSHISRALVYALPFIVYYGLNGFLVLREAVSHRLQHDVKFLFTLIFIILFMLYYSELLYAFLHSMVYEMEHFTHDRPRSMNATWVRETFYLQTRFEKAGG